MSVFRDKFKGLAAASIDDQTHFFLHRFVFALGEAGYSEVLELKGKFVEALKHDDGKQSMSGGAAADFLQKLGKTRTAKQRKDEIGDVDANGDGRCYFIEFLLLNYKVMILGDYFKRKGMEPDVDLGNDGVGLIGVGDRLVEELYAPVPGLDPELDNMMKTFALDQATQASKIAELQVIVDGGGVKAMAAKTSLEKLKTTDVSSMNALEARIAAAIKKGSKKADEQMVGLSIPPAAIS